MLPYEPETRPELTGTDVLIAAGERDPYSSLDQIRRLTEILQGGGASVTTSVEPGAGHNLVQNDLQRLAGWLTELAAGGSD